VLERARAFVSRALRHESVSATASIGAVVSRSGHPSIEVLLKRADALLYDAKANGKDRVSLAALDP
jgi:PleD family two-component response regulator